MGRIFCFGGPYWQGEFNGILLDRNTDDEAFSSFMGYFDGHQLSGACPIGDI
ncbi:hypothetical protein BH10BAC4_BH10BAC4_10190 [soil metagenome]